MRREARGRTGLVLTRACGVPWLQLRLIYANDSPADVALKQDLDALAAGYYGKFKVRAHAPDRLTGARSVPFLPPPACRALYGCAPPLLLPAQATWWREGVPVGHPARILPRPRCVGAWAWLD